MDTKTADRENQEPVVRVDAYAVITNAILDLLERGVVPWRQTWATRHGPPTNLFTLRQYRGINFILLSWLLYRSHYYVTENQARRLRGSVKADEVGHPIIFLSPYSRGSEESADPESRFFEKLYIVYNTEQCEGLKVPSFDGDEQEFKPIEEAAKIIENMPKRPVIRHGGDRACYWPVTDVVDLPTPGSFVSREEYYCTAFHELLHATGHPERLNRKSLTSYSPFGSDEYSREELVAELGAAFLCGTVRMEDKTLHNSAAYISNWLSRLRNDKRLIVTAAATAQRAADYIMNCL